MSSLEATEKAYSIRSAAGMEAAILMSTESAHHLAEERGFEPVNIGVRKAMM